MARASGRCCSKRAPQSPYAPLVALVGALLVGGILASGLEVLGFHLRRRMGDRLGFVDGLGGAVLVACLGLGLGLDRRGGGAADAGGAGAARADPAVHHPARAQRAPSALGTGPAGAGALRPFPQIEGPRPDVAPPNSKIARDPQVRGAGAERSEGARHGLRARRAGQRLGRGRRHRGDQRPRGRRPGRHDRAGAGRGRAADAEAIWFDARNDLAVLRVPMACAGAGAAPRRGAPSRGPRRPSSGSPRTGPTTSSPAASARRRPS